MCSTPASAKRGFTLIELLVVIAIILILASILFPVFGRARDKARSQTCLNNQRQIVLSIMAWSQDEEALPTPLEWIEATKLGNMPKLFDCPINDATGSPSRPDYGYNAYLSDRTGLSGNAIARIALGKLEKPQEVEVTCDISKAVESAYGTLAPLNGAYAVTGFSNEADMRHHTPRGLGREDGLIISYADGHVAMVNATRVTTSFDSYSLPGYGKDCIDFNDYTTDDDAYSAFNRVFTAVGAAAVSHSFGGGKLTINASFTPKNQGSLANGSIVAMDIDYPSTDFQIRPSDKALQYPQDSGFHCNLMYLKPDTKPNPTEDPVGVAGFGFYHSEKIMPSGTWNGYYVSTATTYYYPALYPLVGRPGDPLHIELSLSAPTSEEFIVEKGGGRVYVSDENHRGESFYEHYVRAIPRDFYCKMQNTAYKVDGRPQTKQEFVEFKQPVAFSHAVGEIDSPLIFCLNPAQEGGAHLTGDSAGRGNTITISRIMVAY